MFALVVAATGVVVAATVVAPLLLSLCVCFISFHFIALRCASFQSQVLCLLLRVCLGGGGTGGKG